MPLDINRYCR